MSVFSGDTAFQDDTFQLIDDRDAMAFQLWFDEVTVRQYTTDEQPGTLTHSSGNLQGSNRSW